MPAGFKDLSELHIAAVESAQPEMFHKVIEAAMWRADREYDLSSSSSNSLGVDGDDEESRTLRVERFASLPRYTGARPSVIQGIFPKGFPTSIYGEVSIAKSTIALHMCMSIASGKKQWLGYPIDQPSPCLYVDFELDREEQGTRAERIAKGMGIEIPDDLHYLWASGFRFSDVFPLILEAVDELGVRVVALDSLGMALEGDALKGAVVIDFFRDRIDQLKRRGVSVLIVDHQSGLRPGESYQNKAQYGSVYKGYLSRSRLQLELDERDDVGSRVIVRQNKTNFGAPQVPFVVRTLFEENKIVLSREALSEEDLREESVLNATDRVLLCLLDGPSYPADLQEKTGLAGVGNILTKLKRKELIELTGHKVGKADEVRLTERGQGLAEVIRSHLASSSPHTPSKSGDDEANESGADSSSSCKPPRRCGDDEGKPKKTKKPKGPEEEEELRASLAEKFNYIYTEEGAKRCLEWVKSAPEMALDLSAGDLWEGKIQTALAQSRFIITVVSPSGLESPWMSREWSMAFATEQGRLLPVVVDEALIPTVLREFHILRINRDDERSLDVAVEELSQVIRHSRTAKEGQRSETLTTLGDQSESVPALDYRGVLPQGVYSASLEEVVNRFGSGSAQRDRLAKELMHLADKAREVKAHALVLGGSFISADPDPGDLDVAIVLPEEALEDVSSSDVDVIRSQVTNSKGTVLALGEDSAQLWTNYLENTYTSEPRGVVEIDLSKDTS